MNNKKNNAIKKAEDVMNEITSNNVTEEERRRALIKVNSAKLKAERERKRESEKAQKEIRRERYYEEKHGRKNVVAIIALALISAGLLSALLITEFIPSDSQRLLEATYQKVYYDTVSEVDNMDVNLSKVLATKDKAGTQTYLTDLAVNSEVASSNLSSLPLEDESKFNTIKTINQVGDFAKYLNKKLANGGEITESEYQSLYDLYLATINLKNTLYQVLDGGLDFSNMSDKNNLLTSKFNELENLSVEYPELIYDGPFSDGKDQKEIKGLNGQEVDEGTASKNLLSIFNDYGIKDIENKGKEESGIERYNFSATVRGQDIYAEISVVGGKLIMFSREGTCKTVNYGEDQAIEKAEAFLDRIGITDMKAVWSLFSNNVFTINFVYEKDGIIYYPDMVKVRVCSETLDVIGLEATSYYYNHIERGEKVASIDEDRAKSNVSDNIEIETCRLVVIPVGENEKLCYEFSGRYNESTYYVYIDANSGAQVEIKKVIKSGEGSLLM